MRVVERIAAVFLLLLFTGCDGGLEPVQPPPFGTVKGIVTYEGTWPPADSLRDLRFVAMRITPKSVADLTDLNNIVYTEKGLKRNVERDTFEISTIPNGTYPYCGVAQQYGRNLFTDWRPVGLYEDEFGRGLLVRGDTVFISVHVIWGVYPPFPPIGESKK